MPPTPLDSLYSAHRGWPAHWLQRRLGNAVDAADLAQDTFARLLAAEPAQPQTPALRQPKAYLATVAKHLLINHVRRRSLEQAWLAALAEAPEQHAPSGAFQLDDTGAVLDNLTRMLPVDVLYRTPYCVTITARKK